MKEKILCWWLIAKKPQKASKRELLAQKSGGCDNSDDSEENDYQDIWMRWRCLDGALNRVPVGFYSKVWMILENCRGLQIRGRTLDTFLTQGVSFIQNL